MSAGLNKHARNTSDIMWKLFVVNVVITDDERNTVNLSMFALQRSLQEHI